MLTIEERGVRSAPLSLTSLPLFLLLSFFQDSALHPSIPALFLYHLIHSVLSSSVCSSSVFSLSLFQVGDAGDSCTMGTVNTETVVTSASVSITVFLKCKENLLNVLKNLQQNLVVCYGSLQNVAENQNGLLL